MNLEQHRMKAAWDVATAIEPKHWDAWWSAAMSFGANVQRCGLLQSVVFLLRDHKDVADLLTGAVRDHLVDRKMLDEAARERPLLDALRAMDGDRHMLVTREVLALSIWIRRATQAEDLRREAAAPPQP